MRIFNLLPKAGKYSAKSACGETKKCKKNAQKW